MALAVLDGNQSATTLSSVVTGGEHIVAHSVVSLGSNAISNITTAISGSTVCVGNLGLLQSTVATEGLSASGSFIKIGGHTGTSTTGNIVHVSAVGALRVDGSVYTQPVSIASVTIGNTVTIAGTVTANPTGTQTIAGTVTANVPDLALVVGENQNTPNPAHGIQIGYISDISGTFVNVSDNTSGYQQLPIKGAVTANLGSALPAGTNRIGVVTIGAGTVTIGAGTAQIGSVTASISNFPATQPISISSVTIGNSVTIGAILDSSNQNIIQQGGGVRSVLRVRDNSGTYGDLQGSGVNVFNVPVYGTVTVGNSVTIGSLPAISGTVTANSSNGSLTTRFGSVTTANTAFATSAVTNASRKYLLIQNITTASNVITVGVGFTPTTTQGIQLTAGAGLTFEGSYIPTGAVNLLSSVTASCFTILEA